MFVTTVNYISEKAYPALDDDFVSAKLTAQYGWKTAEEAKAGIEDNIRKSAVEKYVNDYVFDNSEVSIPESVTEIEKKAMLNYYTSLASQYSMSLEDYAKASGYDSADAFAESQKGAIEDSAKSYMILQAIAETENLTFGDNEAKAYFTSNMQGYTDDQYGDFIDMYGKGYIMQAVMCDAVYKLIEESAVLK